MALTTADEMDEPETPYDAERRTLSDEQLKNKARAVVGELERIAQRRVGQKMPIEERWVRGLLQYHGKHEDDIKARFLQARAQKVRRSEVYINQTRKKTDAWAARLYDVLFPTDDKNWGISPSPVPELMQMIEERQTRASGAASAVMRQQIDSQIGATGATAPEAAPKMVALKMVAEKEQAHADEAADIMEEARQRAKGMEAEIDDAFRACNYSAQCRDAIDWMCKIGSAVMRGPVTGTVMERRWKVGLGGKHELSSRPSEKPATICIDPWSYFPDMDSGNNVQNGEGDMVRYLMNKKQLRELARRPGFDQDAIRRLLLDGSRGVMPSFVSQLRGLNGTTAGLDRESYHVWEYVGPLEIDRMKDAALVRGDQLIYDYASGLDPLDVPNVTIWWCQDELLSCELHPMDSGETTFSVACFAKDETVPFGYGVPDLMADPQRVLSSAWRMVMDNAPLAIAPQIIINTQRLEPENGNWTLEGGKVWRVKDGQALEPGHRHFDAFDIPIRTNELLSIITLAMQFIDDMSGMTPIAEGEQGTETTKTAGGMAMLMNSNNVLIRRVARNWDDDMTVPNVRRNYYHLMQHSPKEHIKGDYEVDARGSSVLLVRELQQQNLMALAATFGNDPTFGKMLKSPDLLRQIVAAMMIPADTLVKSDTDIEAAIQAEQEQALAMAAATSNTDLEEGKLEAIFAKIEADEEIANQRDATERYKVDKNYDAIMTRTAEAFNMKLEELEARVRIADDDRGSAERKFAAEAAITAKREADLSAKEKAEDSTGGGTF